ncbi:MULTISPECIES: TonB-dependent siderophore receptor [Sphingobium]|mgnify:CR=1 FL=1|uniref:TonB-dependent siderophore receptor n=1 Tax=Sphingobium yanoikuyae TaxID=13690 RepID=A0A0J9D020_SPHYA|nr:MULTISPECIES: TonB-dependent receptor [Sphingobium]ATP21456.1 TonB-dependent siderophore receptor [Sphingobium yanoikuyae]KMW29981.1 TonB-dependent receptor [Sphingobium yanoikuyae]TKV43886.1 TonB-dependent receptor [Sphingobium sp. MP9-4]
MTDVSILGQNFGRALAIGLLASTATGTALLSPAMAQTSPNSAQRRINVPAQPLTDAVILFGRQSGVEVTAGSDLLNGKISSAVAGNFAPAEALSRLLSGTGLTFRFIGPKSVELHPAPQAANGTVQLGPVRVEGADSGSGSGSFAGITSDPVATEASGSYTIPAMSTATKLLLSPRETPQSLTVVTRQRIEDQGLATLSDVVRATPGLYLTKWGGERYRFNARMFQLENLMIDGMPVQYEEAALSTGILDMYDRVEVVRGAAGLMEGAGTPAGSINLVRKRPTRETQAIFTLSAGSWNNFLGTMDVGGAVNSAGTLRTRAVVTYQDKDSFIDDYHNQRMSLYGIVEADLGSSTLLTVGASYSNEDNPGVDWNGLGTAADGSFLDIARSTRMSPSWSYWDKKSATYFANLDHEFGNGWKARLAATAIQSEMSMIGTFLSYATSTAGETRFNLGGAALAYHYDRDQLSLDGYASGPLTLFGQTHELVVGGSYRKATWDDIGAPTDFTAVSFDPLDWDPRSVPTPTITGDWTMYLRDQKREQIGVYSTARLSVAEPLTLILGGRFDWFKQELANGWAGAIYSTADYKVKGQFTPYVGVVYDFHRNHSLYASWTRIFNPQNNLTRTGAIIAPQEGANYEVGVKGSYWDGHLNTSLALFQIELTNLPMALLASECAAGLTACYAPSGKVRSRGVEFEVSGELAKGWQLSGGYTYNTAKHLSSSSYNPTGIYTDGTRYGTNLPRGLFKLSTTYNLPGAFDRWTLGGTLQAQSKIYSAPYGGLVQQDGYALLDLSIKYAVSSRATVTVNVNNVFDKYYYENVGAPTGSNFIGAPRNVLATLRYKI